jgi:hypothetical protein
VPQALPRARVRSTGGAGGGSSVKAAVGSVTPVSFTRWAHQPVEEGDQQRLAQPRRRHVQQAFTGAIRSGREPDSAVAPSPASSSSRRRPRRPGSPGPGHRRPPPAAGATCTGPAA